MASEPPKPSRRSARSRKTSASAGDDASESSDASYHSAPDDQQRAFPYHDESTVAIRLNPELDPNRHSREDRTSALPRGPLAAQPGNHGAASGSHSSQLISGSSAAISAMRLNAPADFEFTAVPLLLQRIPAPPPLLQLLTNSTRLDELGDLSFTRH